METSVTIFPKKLQGKIQIPASKSVMQRACAAALIRKGRTTLLHLGKSADDMAAVGIVQQLGAKVIAQNNNQTVIESMGQIVPQSENIYCGESGLSVRMFAAIAALSNELVKLTGSGSLLKRPMFFFEEALPKLGVTVLSNKGFLPLHIKGPLQIKDIDIDGSISSQFTTGLLMAYASLYYQKRTLQSTSIHVHELASKQYVDITIDILQKFGLPFPIMCSEGIYHFFPTDFSLIPQEDEFTYEVEGDWSGAAFFLVAGAISGTIKVEGLHMNSLQPDKAIIEVLNQCGATVQIEGKYIVVSKNILRAFAFDATDCPDLFPPLSVLAACCEGTSSIAGCHRLIHKESNRVETLISELVKLGVTVEVKDDVMYVKGVRSIKAGAMLDSHNDHRIAMACAILANCANAPSIIHQADAVNKSYPNFFRDLKKLQGLT